MAKAWKVDPFVLESVKATTITGEEGTQLHELSRIDHILNALIDEVEGNGPIRRVQTFLDSSLHHIEEQSLLILRQRDQILSSTKSATESMRGLKARSTSLERNRGASRSVFIFHWEIRVRPLSYCGKSMES